MNSTSKWSPQNLAEHFMEGLIRVVRALLVGQFVGIPIMTLLVFVSMTWLGLLLTSGGVL